MANRVRRRAREAAQQAAEVQVRQLFKAHKSSKLKKLFGYQTRKYLRAIQYNTQLLPETLRHPKILQVCALLSRFAKRCELRQYHPVYQSPYDLVDEIVAQTKLLPILLSKSHAFLLWLYEGQLTNRVQSWVAPKSSDHFKITWSFVEHCYIRYPHQIPYSLRLSYRTFFYRGEMRRNTTWGFHINMLLHLSTGKGVHTFQPFNRFRIPSKANIFLLRAPRNLQWFSRVLYWACLRAMDIPKSRIQQIWDFFLDYPALYINWGQSILGFLATASFDTEEERIRVFYLVQQLAQVFFDRFPDQLPTYYQSVIRFFLRYIDEIEETECEPWLRYLIMKREEEQQEVKMKGRTPRSFRRQFLAYIYNQKAAANNSQFPLSKLAAFHQEAVPKQYKIVQIVSDYELYLEGYWMGHCVYSYAEECCKGESTIWSLKQLDEKKEWVSKVTIEVKWQKKITQAYARFNRSLNKHQEDLVRAWAARENLAFDW